MIYENTKQSLNAFFAEKGKHVLAQKSCAEENKQANVVRTQTFYACVGACTTLYAVPVIGLIISIR